MIKGPELQLKAIAPRMAQKTLWELKIPILSVKLKSTIEFLTIILTNFLRPDPGYRIFIVYFWDFQKTRFVEIYLQGIKTKILSYLSKKV
jgi:hypothetical protein